MRTPIAQALAAPERIDSGVPHLDLAALAALSFEAPDLERFPCLSLAYDALAAGGSAPIALNAANEIVVGAFLAGHARFLDIASTCARTLERVPVRAIGSIDDALDADAEARRFACDLLALPAEATVSYLGPRSSDHARARFESGESVRMRCAT